MTGAEPVLGRADYAMLRRWQTWITGYERTRRTTLQSLAVRYTRLPPDGQAAVTAAADTLPARPGDVTPRECWDGMMLLFPKMEEDATAGVLARNHRNAALTAAGWPEPARGRIARFLRRMNDAMAAIDPWRKFPPDDQQQFAEWAAGQTDDEWALFDRQTGIDLRRMCAVAALIDEGAIVAAAVLNQITQQPAPGPGGDGPR